MGLHVGQNARIRGSLSSLIGDRYALQDPNALDVTITRPGGTVTTYTYGQDVELVRVGSGRFDVVEPLDEVGTWTVRFSTPTFNRTFSFVVAP